MLFLVIIELVIWIISLPFMLLSAFLPAAPDVTAGVTTLCNCIEQFFDLIVYIITMGGNSIFMGFFRFCLGTMEFIFSYNVILRVIEAVKSIFMKVKSDFS